MKTLLLIRHAKAALEEPGTSDIERILTEQGKNQAHLMGQELKKLKIKPSLILSSPATRAIDTAKLIAEILSYPIQNIETEQKIYSEGVEELIELIKEVDDEVDTLLLFGHNPTLTWLTHFLCEATHINIPNCGIVIINFDKLKNWDKFTEADGKLTHFIHPPHDHSHF